MRTNLDKRIAVASFGIACTIGLVGAFVGLDVSSFGMDELNTAWVFEAGIGFREFLARFLTDLHPPVYYVLAFLHVRLFGDDEVALRGLSAALGVAAVLLFCTATRFYFSLAARLFAAAMATGSFFWFYQTQNARSYTLSLLIGVGILAISLSVLARRSRKDSRLPLRLAGLAVLMLVGSFVHFYLMYLCLAVLIVLCIFCPRQRLALAALAVTLLVLSATYVKFVTEVFSQYALKSPNWFPADQSWYLQVLYTALNNSFSRKGLLALAVCAGALVAQRLYSVWRRVPPGGASLRASGSASSPASGAAAFGRTLVDPETILFVGVPIIVTLGGIASSVLISPNFNDRNLLICSPFLWACCARLYDAAVPNAVRPIRATANLALSAVVVWMAVTMVAGRAQQWKQPFRQSAEMIRSFPECRNQPILVINAQPSSWFKPGYSELLYAKIYARYLGDFATPRVLFLEDIVAHKIPKDVADDLQRRMEGHGCPILAWSIHFTTEEELELATRELLQAIGQPSARGLVRTEVLRDGSPGYIVHYAVPGSRSPGAARNPE